MFPERQVLDLIVNASLVLVLEFVRYNREGRAFESTCEAQLPFEPVTIVA